MDESCKAAQDAAPLRDQSQRSREIVVKVLIQVIQCSYFVKEYCGERSFGMHENIPRGITYITFTDDVSDPYFAFLNRVPKSAYYQKTCTGSSKG